ncbi:MAG TPA: DUF2179 domain-containing protein [Longimicrobiales bacterium]|nr:DUF2179 domain-containing protein [Longimicrobiales bacterium]
MLETLFAGPLGPLVIFSLRIVDVSLATTRMLLAVRSQKLLVPLIGFIEVLIWLYAAGTAIRFLDSPLHVIGYAAGFAAGNVVGLWMEEKLAFGLATVRIISAHGGVELADALRAKGFGVTEFAGQGREGPVEVVYTVARRSQIRPILREVDHWDPRAFVTVEEPRAIHRGWMFDKRRK